MRTYKVVLDDKGYFHELVVVAYVTQEAIDMAREEIGDKDKKTVLYSIDAYDKGVVSRRAYY